MKIRSLVAAANIGFMFLLVLGIKAEAAELKVLSATGMQTVMEDLGPKFERATGHKLAITFATLGGVGAETRCAAFHPRCRPSFPPRRPTPPCTPRRPSATRSAP